MDYYSEIGGLFKETKNLNDKKIIFVFENKKIKIILVISINFVLLLIIIRANFFLK